MERPTPRVNSALLGNYIGRIVRITGKVVSLDGDSATIEASDQGQVTVKLSQEANFSEAFVEVIGRVGNDLTVQEYTSVNMGDNIDMGLVEQTVQLIQQHPDLFGIEA